jgi:hypothetical protein
MTTRNPRTAVIQAALAAILALPAPIAWIRGTDAPAISATDQATWDAGDPAEDSGVGAPDATPDCREVGLLLLDRGRPWWVHGCSVQPCGSFVVAVQSGRVVRPARSVRPARVPRRRAS